MYWYYRGEPSRYNKKGSRLIETWLASLIPESIRKHGLRQMEKRSTNIYYVGRSCTQHFWSMVIPRDKLRQRSLSHQRKRLIPESKYWKLKVHNSYSASEWRKELERGRSFRKINATNKGPTPGSREHLCKVELTERGNKDNCRKTHWPWTSVQKEWIVWRGLPASKQWKK